MYFLNPANSSFQPDCSTLYPGKKQKKTGPSADANDPVNKLFKLNFQALEPVIIAIQLETVRDGNLNVGHAVTVSCSAILSLTLTTIANL